MSLEVLSTLMLVAFFVLLLAGIPVGLTLATTGFVFGYLGFGMDLFNLLPHRIFGVVTNYYAARHSAVRVHGRDAGEIQARRGTDGRDRARRRLAAAAGSASASSWSAC